MESISLNFHRLLRGPGGNARMLVRCPNCQTTYKVSDNLVQRAGPTFRCSRCKHTFAFGSHSQSKGGESQHSDLPNQLPVANDEERELSFSFPPREGAKNESSVPSSEPTPTSPLDPDRFASLTEGREETWSLSSSEPHSEQSFTILAEEPSGGFDNEEVARREISSEEEWRQNSPSPHEGSHNILSLDPHRDRSVSTLPFLVLFGLLVLFFSLFTAIDQANPDASEGYIKSIPWLGSSLFKNNHLKNSVVVQSLRSSFLSILGNREVFVVSGVASNQNPMSVRDVQVAGQLYNAEGKDLEQQKIWVGNAISPKIIRGMTAQDISDLQRLKPLRSFEIPSGESVPFTIVFLKSSKNITNFSCQIISAEGEV
jgi:predicted Zn finger-like uncharacterized protein